MEHQAECKRANHSRYERSQEVISAARANRSEEDRIKERARVSAFYKANPGKKRAQIAQRRAKRKMEQLEAFTIGDLIRGRGCACHICGIDTIADCPDIKLRPTIDHVVPLKFGGTHCPENARIAHQTCNASKGARTAFDDAAAELCRRRVSEYLRQL
jgi:5-methylcytosine-specific restriction endonuclease McrA